MAIGVAKMMVVDFRSSPFKIFQTHQEAVLELVISGQFIGQSHIMANLFMAYIYIHIFDRYLIGKIW